MSSKPIGLFDSGVGGLSVWREIRRQLPGENVLYFGDTAHMPYGPRSPEDLKRIVYTIINFLQDNEVKLVIMACNTSSAVVLPQAVQDFRVPLLGMIRPVAQALADSPEPCLGVLATEATVRSKVYELELRSAGYQGQVLSSPCPALATMVEAGSIGVQEQGEVDRYVAPLRVARVVTTILGCTHYPFAEGSIRLAFGTPVTLIDPARLVVAEAAALLETRRLANKELRGRTMFYTSGSAHGFAKAAQRLCDTPITAQHVDIFR